MFYKEKTNIIYSFFKKTNTVYLQTTQVVQINKAKRAIKHGGLYKNWVKWRIFSNSTPYLIRLKQAI